MPEMKTICRDTNTFLIVAASAEPFILNKNNGVSKPRIAINSSVILDR